MAKEPFIIYKASAGAGKTHTLVREYLKMAFELGEGSLGEALRSILAITFTNKAAAEMKERILKELRIMASAPADPAGDGMGADLLRELGPTVSPEALQHMADSLYTTILHHYSDLSVSTIDSFTQRIVRTFAHDFGQPMNFDITLDQKELINQAVAQLMSLAGTAGYNDLTDVLKDFAESRMDDDNSYDIERPLTALAEQLFNEDIGVHLKKLSGLTLSDYMKIRADYAKRQVAAEVALKACGAEAVKALDDAGLGAAVCHQGDRGFYGFFAKIAAGGCDEPTSYTAGSFANDKFYGAKATPGQRAAMDALAPKLRDCYDRALKLIAECNTYSELLNNIYSVALLGELDRQMRLYTHDNDIIHLSDFNRMINKMVEDDDNPAPFIYERLGNRYRHFLIDEFQDTSIMQWHNMVPLLENGVSQGQESLVVGDGKQSIYRFRQGDVAQFVRLPQVEGMRHHGRTLSMKGNSDVRGIADNRRSGTAIIDFNNRLFTFLARKVYTDNPMVQDIYIGRDSNGALNAEGSEDLFQHDVNPWPGYVRLDIVSKADAAADGFAEVNDAIYERVCATIETMHNERGYSYGEIAVLTRWNSELTRVSEYLTQHYPHVRQTSTESFYLSNSHAVKAIIAALRLVVNRGDRVARADLQSHLDALGIHGELDIDLLAAMNLYDCCEEVVRELNLEDIDSLYVASLLNRAAAFASRHRQEPGQFLEWYDSQKKLSAASSDDLDAVQLLTIHKSKGLGKPVIICPVFFGKERSVELWVEPGTTLGDDKGMPTTLVSLSNKKRTLFEPLRHREQLMTEVDELNVMYVAFTRAKQQLFIFTPDVADQKKPREHDRRTPSLLKAFAPKGCTCGDADFMRIGGKEEHKDVVTLKRLSYDDWSDRVSIASPAEKAVTSLMEDRRRFGIYAHDLLATVLHADDVEEAIQRFADSRHLTDDEKAALGALARSVVGAEQTARFFDPRHEAKNECDLVAVGHRYRPDRVVFTPTETWVVDFKTGTPQPDHRSQVLNYCKALNNMGYPAVSGYLLYLTPEITVEAC